MVETGTMYDQFRKIVLVGVGAEDGRGSGSLFNNFNMLTLSSTTKLFGGV